MRESLLHFDLHLLEARVPIRMSSGGVGIFVNLLLFLKIHYI